MELFFILMTVEMYKTPVAQSLRSFQYECRYNRVRLYLFVSSNINYRQCRLYITALCVHFQAVRLNNKQIFEIICCDNRHH
jgi:hypothetical protein